MSEETVIPEATFDDILEQYEQEEGEFEYVVGDGKKAKKYRARRVVNISDKIEISEKAEEFRKLYERIRAMGDDKVPEVYREWKKFARRPMHRKSANFILFISTLLISPKLSQLQCLRLHDRGGDALVDIAVPLMGMAEQDVAEGEDAEIAELKND